MSDRKMRLPAVSGAYPSVATDGLQTAKPDDGVFVVVTQAFDPDGNNLINPEETFDGFPGVSVWIETPDGESGRVTLSPIHGDTRKSGFSDVAEGTPLVVRGIEGGPELEAEAECQCGKGTYRRVYLSPKLDKGDAVLLCNVWGCHRSRIIDEAEVLSWVDY
ncbi:MAG: hypothetical protein KC561_10855 [Myxococcales bacterium]|nr:hypothetical protein [Myxococcales bacterium]